MIPKSLQEAHHWEPGQELVAIAMGDGILLKPKKPFAETTSTSEECVNVRKSNISSKEIGGNADKYESYREAWSRIKLAQENHFFLEAITIQESIISDRLISLLTRLGALKPLAQQRNGQYPSFGNLIRLWRSEFSGELQSGSYPDIIAAVDQWRLIRNEAIHAIVKSEPGKPTQLIDLFLQKAKETAEEGERLTREVCKWCGKEKNRKPSSEDLALNAEELFLDLDAQEAT